MSSLKSYAPLGMLRMRQSFGANTTTEDSKLLAKLRAATQMIDRHTARYFQPEFATHLFDFDTLTRLVFRSQELLSLTSLVDGQGRTINTSAILWRGGHDTSTGPYYGFDLDPTIDYMLYITTPYKCIAVKGAWGWHDNYATAFHASGVTINQSGGIDNAVTTIPTSTNDSTIIDAWGQQWSPKAYYGTVQPGHLIQIDSEWMQVLAATTTQLTVLRAANGTTAATHANSTAIQIYEAPRDIQDITTRYASWLYAQDSSDYGQVTLDAFGRRQVPMGLPADISDDLELYTKRRVA